MKATRVILTVFGLLDAMLLGRNLSGVVVPHFSILRGLHGTFSFACMQVLFFLVPFFLVSLAVSAIGLALERRWALILSYAQFPFRIAILYLSFGFLTRLTVPFLGEGAYRPTIIVAIGLEAARLVSTILLHMRIAKLSRT